MGERVKKSQSEYSGKAPDCECHAAVHLFNGRMSTVPLQGCVYLLSRSIVFFFVVLGLGVLLDSDVEDVIRGVQDPDLIIISTLCRSDVLQLILPIGAVDGPYSLLDF